MKRVHLLSRVPVKLSAIFLVLVVISGAASVLITLRVFEERQVEIDQRLNVDVASSMAQELEPLIAENSGEGAIGSAMHYMMVMNPAVEIYLLDGTGTILDYFASPGPPVRVTKVDVAPIHAFLDHTRPLPILGDNPRRPDEPHHFSAAPIRLASGAEGYLYVILRGTEYDAASMDLQRGYLDEALRTSLLITIPLVAVVGLFAFFFSTLPLQRLTRTVRAFGAGDVNARSTIATRDEIGDLARNFNVMAQTIVANMDRLEYADRERRELIANISHDLRNPLATIQGYLETLSQKDVELDASERAAYYEMLLGVARTLPRLVEDLFELSKLDAPGVTPSMERFSVAELVQDVVMQWGRRAADHGVTLGAPRPDELNFATGNVGMIERVLTNLIQNAIAHTPSGGSIEVSSRREVDAVIVRVTDTGVGIALADQGRVFDRFFIGDASRTSAHKGSGLGLAICKRIVELHGGRITLDSEPGHGTTFTFTIPSLASHAGSVPLN